MPEKPFDIYEEDFVKTLMDYEMFRLGISPKAFEEKLLQKVLYGSKVTSQAENTVIIVKGDSK